MKTDLTRDTFDPDKRFSSVRLKQGAVQMDADWNEEIDILGDRETTQIGDIVGASGAPQGADGFHLLAAGADLTPVEAARPGNQPLPALAAGDLLVTAGRAYVEGRLIRNPAICTLATQPDLPGAAALGDPGLYLAYLDVWERSITSLEDPAIREVALGGPSTATRTRRVWQIRTLRIGDSGDSASCNDDLPAYDSATAASDGRMAARAEPDPAASGPCVVPESAGYRSLENQLYRVECIAAGDRDTARFVWSRENGSVVTGWLGQNGPELTVGDTGPDRAHGFANGDWVELFDEARELDSQPGTLVRVLSVRNDVLVIDPATAAGSTDITQFPVQARIRRWDGDGAFAADGDNWSALEQGVEVRFAPGSFRIGDFWMIPARTITGDVEWPRDGLGDPSLLLPKGVAHHHARLALLDFDGSTVTATDCRPLFPPLTGLMQIDYAGGDGQQAMPDLTAPGAGVLLPEPLRVAVSRGATPVAGAQVRFRIASGGGQVDGGAESLAETGPDGTAAVTWRLGAVGQPQRVEAQLLAPGGAVRHVPLTFGATFSTAAQVAIDPGACPAFANARNVQEALTILCQQGGGEDPGFRIRRLIWRATGLPYRHDGPVSMDVLMQGLEITCDDAIDPVTVIRRPTVFVTLFGRNTLLPPEIVTSGYRIAAALEVQENLILWQPNPNLPQIQGNIIEGVNRPLCELTIRGHNIRAQDPAADGSPRWLDADALERPDRQILPTGDRRSGGNFLSWFWLGEDRPDLDLRLVRVERQTGGRLHGRVIDRASGDGLAGASVSMALARGEIVQQTTRSRPDGEFGFDEVPAQSLIVAAAMDGAATDIAVPRLVLHRDPLPPDIFPIRDVAGIETLSANMRTRLRRAGLDDPFIVANLDAPEIARRLGVTEATAIEVLTAIRDTARPR